MQILINRERNKGFQELLCAEPQLTVIADRGNPTQVPLPPQHRSPQNGPARPRQLELHLPSRRPIGAAFAVSRGIALTPHIHTLPLQMPLLSESLRAGEERQDRPWWP